MQTGIVSDLKVAPQQTVKVQIPFDTKNICPCKELLLNVSYKLKAAETLLPAGTTIAYDQLSIRDYKAPELKLENQQASNLPVIVPTILDNDRNFLIVKGEHMIEAFQSGADIHAATAAKIYGIPVEEVTSDMRRKAKTANFGIIYGISVFGLAERMNVDRKEAKELIDGYFRSEERRVGKECRL